MIRGIICAILLTTGVTLIFDWPPGWWTAVGSIFAWLGSKGLGLL